MENIKDDVSKFLDETGLTIFKLSKLSKVNHASLYLLVSGRRRFLRNDTEAKLRKAMADYRDSLSVKSC